MSDIKIYVTPEEKSRLTPGRYYILVKVKIPTVMITGAWDSNEGTIEPRLDTKNSPQHSDPRVLLSELSEVIVDITDHLDCPTEHTVAAADKWLSKHFNEVDRVLRHKD